MKIGRRDNLNHCFGGNFKVRVSIELSFKHPEGLIVSQWPSIQPLRLAYERNIATTAIISFVLRISLSNASEVESI
jgi:hypothetical protein